MYIDIQAIIEFITNNFMSIIIALGLTCIAVKMANFIIKLISIIVTFFLVIHMFFLN